MSNNPYHPPDDIGLSQQETVGRAPWQPRFFVWLAAYLAPLLAAIGFYQSWFVARLCLGHWPIASLDDPKSIGGAMTVSYVISMLAVLGFPFCIFLSFLACFYSPIKTPGYEGRDRVILVFQSVTMCVLLWMFIRRDPGGVIYWWLD